MNKQRLSILSSVYLQQRICQKRLHVASLTSKLFASASKCRSLPASSKSEFVSVSKGMSSMTNASLMCWGHSQRQTMGFVFSASVSLRRGLKAGPQNQTPPMPALEVSWYPIADGFRGTTSAILVGRTVISLNNHRKLSSAWYTPFLRLIRVPIFDVRASCMWLNKWHNPGNAKDIDHSCPNTLCHFWLKFFFEFSVSLINFLPIWFHDVGGAW